MQILDASEEKKFRLLIVKAIFFVFMISILLFVNFLIQNSSLDEDYKKVILGIDFWGTAAYSIYFILTGLWILIRIDYFKQKRNITR